MSCEIVGMANVDLLGRDCMILALGCKGPRPTDAESEARVICGNVRR